MPIGKLGISNRILDKPAPLTPREFARVRDHPQITQRILERVPGLRDFAFLTGVRIGELAALEVDDVRLTPANR
jgi:HD-GYP domain-containing protein (c-di-GMP phosphodiesterase class II)